MASQIQIVNMALHQLGAARITSMTDDSEAARVATDIWDICRDSVLVDHNWNFATSRATLAELSTTPDFGYDHQFVLPTDPYCLRVLGMPSTDSIAEYKYRVETVKVGAQIYRVLLTDETACEIEYIGRITDTTLYHPKFVDALAARLASEMAMKITESRNKEKLAWEKYKMILVDARSVDAMEGTPEVIEAEEWLDARE
jgi:hypothetical protein